jgi:hypothetical protein
MAGYTAFFFFSAFRFAFPLYNDNVHHIHEQIIEGVAIFRFCYATINAAYKKRTLQSTPLSTAWFNHLMRAIHVWHSRTPAGVRWAHFFYCNHNIRGSGIK